MTALWQIVLLYGIVMTFGANCLGLVAFVPLLSRHFVRRRGMAISIVQSANGIARGISAPAVQWSISLIGWRLTYLVQAAVMAAVVLPLAALFRRTEPRSGLLRRWLTREGRDTEPADLLDALNSRLDDADFRIGPSYLMKRGVYREGGLERAWRTKILPLLEEYHYGEGVDVEKRYGLAALRESLG